MRNILLQIADIAEREGVSIGALERKIGASKGVLSRAIANNTDIQAKWIQLIVENYPQYNIEWIITGNGSILRDDKKTDIYPLNIENKVENPLQIVDNSSMGFILDRYEALVAKNAILEKENEHLKHSRGKSNDPIPYSASSSQISIQMVAEPQHK